MNLTTTYSSPSIVLSLLKISIFCIAPMSLNGSGRTSDSEAALWLANTCRRYHRQAVPSWKHVEVTGYAILVASSPTFVISRRLSRTRVVSVVHPHVLLILLIMKERIKVRLRVGSSFHPTKPCSGMDEDGLWDSFQDSEALKE